MRNASSLKNSNTDPALVMAPPMVPFRAPAQMANAGDSGRAGAGRNDRAPGIRAVRIVLLSTVAVLAFSGTPTFAGGGDGGGGAGSGGASSLTGAGDAGRDGASDFFEDVGGGGGGAGVTNAGDGGDGVGGSGPSASAGGAGGAGGASNGDPGGDGGNGTPNFRAGSGGGGGAGAAGLVSDDSPGAAVTGGNGGAGGGGGDFQGDFNNGFGGSGGGGGAGGFGFVLSGDGPGVDLPSSSGGDGGDGGAGGDSGVSSGGAGNGGGGGDGGLGVLVQGNRSVTVNAAETVTGGSGGDGGDGGDSNASFLQGSGGDGGAGGAGIVASSGSFLSIAGTVAGGDGGAGGAAGTGINGSDGAAGAGGVGILGADMTLTVTNGGSVSGGLDGTGAVRANAIEFTGGTNTLSLQSGFSITGDVIANGSNDTFELGGITDDTFDVSAFGAAGQYQGFEAFHKTGSSKWTLTGENFTERTDWTVTGGTLAIEKNMSLGHADGTLTLDGGTLEADFSWTNLHDITLGAGGGTLVVDGNSISHGDISGTGGLTKTGASVLMLSNAGSYTYTGGTTISAGELTLLDNTIPGAIANNAQLNLEMTRDFTLAGNISGTGVVEKSGGGAVTLTGTNTYTGGTNVLGGTLIGDSNSLQGDILNNANLTFDQASEGTYAGVLSGNGVFTKAGAGELILTADSSAYAGSTDVNAGLLTINGALGGLLSLNGGRVGGSGTLGEILVHSGATVAPGNSIGTLNVTDITFGAGSTYEVEVNSAGQSDLINVTGAATINGGAVRVLPFPDYALGTTYTIVTAAGGVTGSFDSASYGNGSIFITPMLTYDASNAFVTLAQTADFADVAATPNQIAAAAGAQSVGSGDVFNAIIPIGSNAEAQAAFDAISGEIHASAKTALLDDSRFAREATLDRLRVAFDGVGANTADHAQRRISESFAVWGKGFGSWGNWSSDGNAAAMGRNIGGLFIGGDAEIADNVTLGLMGGYSRSFLNVADRMSSGTVDSYTLGAYAGGNWGGFSLKGGVAHSWHSLATSRSAAFTGFSDTLSASYNARTFQAYTEAAYSIATGNARFEPFANLAYVHLNTDGITETGGAAALTSAGQSSNAAFTTLGIRGDTQVDLGGTEATLSGGLGWRHAFGNTPSSTHSFVSGGSAFTVAGVPLARDTLVLDAGFDVNIGENAKIGISYSGQLGSGISDHGARLGLNVNF